MQASESIISVCFNSSLLKYGGDIAVGAMTILTSVMQFAMLPAAGSRTRFTADHQLQLWSQNVDRVKSAFKLLLKVSLTYSRFPVALRHDLPAGICRNVHLRCHIACIYCKSAAHLSGMSVYVRYPDCLPDDIYIYRKS